MAKILVGCTGFKSNLFSSIALAEKLRCAGHKVVFAATEDSRPWIEHVGFQMHAIVAAKTGGQTAYGHPFDEQRTRAARRDRLHEGVRLAKTEGFAHLLVEEKPDLVLADCEHHLGIIQTLATDTPLGLLSFMYLTPPSPSAPPLNSLIQPGVGWKGSPLGIRLKWMQHWINVRRKHRRAAQDFWGLNSIAVHRALARESGVNLRANTTTWSYQGPWSYRLPTLYLVPEALNFATKLFPGHVFAGPMVLRNRPAQEMPAACAAFLADESRNRIYITFGSLRRPLPGFHRTLVELANQHPDWHLLVAVQTHEKFAQLGAPINLSAVPWAPQLEMLEAVDCSLHHGGAGTVNECVVTRTPMVIVPNGLDGGGNGTRVVAAEAGKLTDFSGGVARIERDVSDVLQDQKFQSGVDNLASSVTNTKENAERFVAHLLAGHTW